MAKEISIWHGTWVCTITALLFVWATLSMQKAEQTRRSQDSGIIKAKMRQALPIALQPTFNFSLLLHLIVPQRRSEDSCRPAGSPACLLLLASFVKNAFWKHIPHLANERKEGRINRCFVVPEGGTPTPATLSSCDIQHPCAWTTPTPAGHTMSSQGGGVGGAGQNSQRGLGHAVWFTDDQFGWATMGHI